MPGTFLGEVSTSQLVGGAQTAVALTPQASDPAVSTSTAQIYAKTDKNIYHEDTAGVITNLLLPALIANNAVAGTTTTYPYGSFNATGPLMLSSGASQNVRKGYVARGSGSVIGATWMGAAPNAGTGTVQVYKNNALFFTALTGTNFLASSADSGPVSATYPAGTYPYVKNDYFDVYYTGSGSGLYMGVGITFNEGNAFANPLSTGLSANTTIAVTDNQRTWLASSSTQYTLTLPATQASQDFYARVVVTGTGGVKVQAPAGVTIYNGQSTSSAGGTVTATAVGAYALLYNPAGTNLWAFVAPSSLWVTA